MKRLFSKLFKKKEKKERIEVYHINYSDPVFKAGQKPFFVGTVRNSLGIIIGFFTYIPCSNYGVVMPHHNDKNYFIPKSADSDWQAPDAYIDPELGGLTNIHSLREFLKKEFAI